jgi:hypothetical protein
MPLEKHPGLIDHQSKIVVSIRREEQERGYSTTNLKS